MPATSELRFLDVMCDRCAMVVKVVERDGARVVQIARAELARHCVIADGSKTRTCHYVTIAVIQAVRNGA